MTCLDAFVFAVCLLVITSDFSVNTNFCKLLFFVSEYFLQALSCFDKVPLLSVKRSYGSIDLFCAFRRLLSRVKDLLVKIQCLLNLEVHSERLCKQEHGFLDLGIDHTLEEVLLHKESLPSNINTFFDLASFDLLLCQHLHDLSAFEINWHHAERTDHAQIGLPILLG